MEQLGLLLADDVGFEFDLVEFPGQASKEFENEGTRNQNDDFCAMFVVYCFCYLLGLGHLSWVSFWL